MISLAGTFFQNAAYIPKVQRQMNFVDDIYHAFPKSVDRYAAEFGKWSVKIGSDGKIYQWLELGKTGVFCNCFPTFFSSIFSSKV